MSKLEMTAAAYFEVDGFKLERFIQGVYDRPDYSIIAAEEWHNDSVHDFHADGELDEWDEADLDKFSQRIGPAYGRLHVLLNDCVRRGRIPAGEYLVGVCW